MLSDLNHVHMPVEEFEAPSVRQAIDFVEFVEQSASKGEVQQNWHLTHCGLFMPYDIDMAQVLAWCLNYWTNVDFSSFSWVKYCGIQLQTCQPLHFA